MALEGLIPLFLILLGAALVIPVKTISDKGMKGMLLMLFAVALGFNTWLLWNIVFGAVDSYSVNVFVADGASLFVTEVILLIGLMSLIYSIKYMAKTPLKTGVYYGIFALFIASMIGTTLATEAVALYAFLETITVTSAVLILYGRGAALRSTMIYLVIAIFGAILVLVGIFFMYTFTGTTLITGASDLPFLTDFQRLLISSFFFVGFGIKAGVVPFGLLWLPPAHSDAPTPISAILSGIMIKVGAFAMVRTIYIFYPGLDILILTVSSIGIASVLIGGILAFFQNDIKRLLAFSSISQIGYIILSFGLGTLVGIEGGLFHLLNHAIFKSLLFLTAGNVILRVNTRNIREMGGLWNRMPITLFVFLIGMFSIIGWIPGFSGYQSKTIIHHATIAAGFPIFGILADIGTIITILYLGRAIIEIFIKRPKNPSPIKNVKEAPVTMLIPTIILALLCIVIGVFPGLVSSILEIASNVLGGLIS
ncbi:MAG: complex I subunit 5 family protein [Candidatus Hodarchaeota archaeon]